MIFFMNSIQLWHSVVKSINGTSAQCKHQSQTHYPENIQKWTYRQHEWLFVSNVHHHSNGFTKASCPKSSDLGGRENLMSQWYTQLTQYTSTHKGKTKTQTEKITALVRSQLLTKSWWISKPLHLRACLFQGDSHWKQWSRKDADSAHLSSRK